MKTRIFAAVIIMFALCMIAGQSVYSQGKPKGEKPSPEQMAKRMADMLDDELNLTDAQYTQVYDIVKDYASTHTRDTFERDELNQKIKAVLTGDQQSKFDDVMENMPPPGSRRGR